ncbi:helix-turn-helix transcriptional regulator [Sporichthya sp.]|uniref:helix-turn-helix domain-containing protein n=1 Tax=Sporichthya sp. TaxID=65475 RepID=UPI0018467DCA|nr:helix-turn-helix transcriptional regulator [Sporichthya sp.]MBA3745251.1 helix-turn-helix transcriptional regulator [Sporichthya sp.]
MSETTIGIDEVRRKIKDAPLPLIAARMRRARRHADISHDAIGQRMGGVTRQHLIKLEQGKHRPGPEMLIRYAEATGKPVDYFLVEESGEPNPFPEDEAA